MFFMKGNLVKIWITSPEKMLCLEENLNYGNTCTFMRKSSPLA